MVDSKVGPNGGYTVYRPAKLGENAFMHAPIIFGPGIGQQVTVHATMLTNFASHGFVVVGTPVLNGGPGDAANLKSMKDGLDWILQQNTAQGSVYLGKLDVKRAVSMGYSVGGTSAVQLGGHEAVATTVSIHGHKAMAALHGPLLQTTGTKDTVGLPLQQQTYATSRSADVPRNLDGGGPRVHPKPRRRERAPRDPRLAPLLDLQRQRCQALLLRHRLRALHGAVGEPATQELALAHRRRARTPSGTPLGCTRSR